MKRKWLSLLLVLCLLLSACTSVTPNADDTKEQSDGDGKISCMSFNILAYNTDDDSFEDASVRSEGTLATVKKYTPDIVGIQEATENYGGSNFDWLSFLQEGLSEIYDSRAVIDEEDCSYFMMGIAAGLVIFYKKDRFELKDSGCYEYAADPNRYYQWVELYDKTNRRELFVTNTHLSIDAGNPEQGNEDRLSEAEELLSFWQSKIGDRPMFATGDYNCNIYSEPQLHLQRDVYFPSALLFDPEGESSLDFCYMNKNCMKVTGYEYIEREYLAENEKTFLISDHHPVMTYAEYVD